jgi:prolyl-tRNA synthetase
MYEKAHANREKHTYDCKTIDEINAAIAENGDGFVRALWCGEEDCEDEVKAKTGIGSRCIPLTKEKHEGVCVCCGKPASQMVLWGKAY